MKLEWFRTHKNFVYWILLPLVGGTMIFYFGPMGRGGFHLGKSMPSVRYTVDNTTRVVGPYELLGQRQMMAQFTNRRDIISHEAGAALARYQTALDHGFEVGKDEMTEDLLSTIKQQIRMREQMTEDMDDNRAKSLYQSLLDNMKLTPAQFETMAHQFAVSGKWYQFVREHPVNDGETFAEFCRDKEVVRLRYKELKSSDYDSKVTAPTADKVTEFYNKHKDDKENPADKELLMAKPTMSADFLFYDTATLFKEVKPTADELQKYYDDHKMVYWRKELKQGDPAPAPGKEEFKPFSEVKGDVEKKWIEYAKRTRPGDEMRKLYTELAKAEKDWNDAEAKKPEAERKPFNMDEWAGKHNLKHWVTDELTEDQYGEAKTQNQKEPEKMIGAKNAFWVEGLFHWPMEIERDTPPQYLQHFPPGYEKQRKEDAKKRFEEFTMEQVDPNTFADPKAVDKGIIAYRKKVYNKEHLMTLDQAKPAIEARLKVDEANDLAKKDAEKMEQDWKDGKNIPAIDTLEEIKSDFEDAFKAGPLARQFFETPKAVGEVLVATGPEFERKPGEKGPFNLHKKYYVGFAVERQLPTLDTFDHDTKWDRTSKRQGIAQSYSDYISELIGQAAWGETTVFPQNVPDPPLNEAVRRGED